MREMETAREVILDEKATVNDSSSSAQELCERVSFIKPASSRDQRRNRRMTRVNSVRTSCLKNWIETLNGGVYVKAQGWSWNN